MDKARFDTRGKLAHVLYALLIFIVGAAIAGAAGHGHHGDGSCHLVRAVGVEATSQSPDTCS